MDAFPCPVYPNSRHITVYSVQCHSKWSRTDQPQGWCFVWQVKFHFVETVSCFCLLRKTSLFFFIYLFNVLWFGPSTRLFSTQNAAFLYGLGMVYFHYNAFQWWVQCQFHLASNNHIHIRHIGSQINLWYLYYLFAGTREEKGNWGCLVVFPWQLHNQRASVVAKLLKTICSRKPQTAGISKYGFRCWWQQADCILGSCFTLTF